MKYFISIFLLVLTISVHAQTEFKFSSPQLDGHTLGHVGKGALTYTGFRLLTAKKEYAVMSVLICAIAYEIIHDGAGLTKHSDPAGADLVGDVVADCFGGVVMYGLEILFRLDKRLDKISIGVTRNEIQLCIAL